MVEENKKSPSGIKLFGATISVDSATVVRENLKKSEDPSSPEKMNSRPPPPDKMIPCPRCKSTETKFCYFNNYNVNQPRHFCRGCQRYWTAGGALRNVPVGAGRRKAKPPGREGCLFDATAGTAQQLLDFDAVVEEWRAVSEERGGFRQFLPGKRRRFATASN